MAASAGAGAGPVRLLHWIGSLDLGGEQRYLARIANRLDPAEFEQTVVYAFGSTLRDEFAPHVRLCTVLGRKPNGLRLRDWDLTREIWRVLRDRRVELCATQSPGIGQLAASLAAKARRLPVVHTIQRAFGLRSRTESVIIENPALRRLAYSLTDRFVGLSSYYLEDQRTRWKIPAQKLVLNYMGVDLDEYRPDEGARADARRELGFGPETPVLGLVARHSPEKGVGRALTGFAAVHARVPGARLLLVGDGPSRAAHVEQVKSSGLERAVIFAGARRDTARLVNGCDVMLQATYNPLNGISSIEAMAIGKPVVTVVDSIDEEEMAADTCVEGENGLFLRTGRIEESAEKLAAILVDRAALDAMGIASRSMASRFDIRRHVAELARLYRSLVIPSPESRFR
jgi:glycosyltransferase involved in cell wall biosynthesis